MDADRLNRLQRSLQLALDHEWPQLDRTYRRVARLEQDGPKHLPYKTADEIEDATAAILRIKHEADFNLELIENAMAHLQLARNPKEK